MLKKVGFVLLSLVVLSGCVNQEHFVKQNVTYDRYERDYVACATKASQEVPTNTQVSWAPYVGVYSADTNSALRQKNFEICMRDKGYQKVALPYCSGDAQKAATKLSKGAQDLSARMSISANSCYITTADGSPFLYSGG